MRMCVPSCFGVYRGGGARRRNAVVEGRAMAVRPALLVFMLALRVGLSLDGAAGDQSCSVSNYEHGCSDGDCDLSISWMTETDNVVSIQISAVVPETEEELWRVRLSLSRAPIEVELSCQIDGEVSQHCSAVDCGTDSNVSYYDHLLDCRFTLADNDVLPQLLSEPVSLQISAGNGSESELSIKPDCLCDISDCQDTCAICDTLPSSKCHSVFSLLLIQSHAILMVVSFLLLVPSGVSISRYSKPVFPHSWFRAHATVNSAAVFLSLLALGAVLGHTKGTFTVGVHQVTGVVAISLMFFQALCGYLRPAAGVSLQRRIFRVIHRSSGIVILTIGTAAMFLGTYIYRNSVYPMALLVLVLAIAVEVIFFIALEVVMRRNYMVSVPVGYQRVEGGDGEDEDIGAGEGEGGEEKVEIEKGQELQVLNGAKDDSEKITKKKMKISKPLRQSHTATKRLLDAFTIQALLFSTAVGFLLIYGSH